MNSSLQLTLSLSMAAAFVAAGVTLAFMYRAERDMQRTGGPGLVPFELAESAREADRFLRAWGPDGRAAVRRSLRWNYGFLLAYVVLFVAATLHVAAQADAVGYRPLVWLESAAAVAVLVAGAADILENVKLRAMLDAHERLCADKEQEPARYATTTTAARRQITVTRRAARLKFLLTGVVSAVVLAGFGVVELSGRPATTATMLPLFLGVTAATAAFLTITLRRRA